VPAPIEATIVRLKREYPGWDAAINGGVDVLAHVTEDLGAWPPAALSRARERRMALIPTLKLLAGMDTTPKQQGLLEQVRQYLGRGGQILFGTDVGFIPDEDPTEEYLLMQRAGMSWPAILAALTTEPASRFRPGAKAARVAAGYEADLVVLEGDPARDLRSLSRVRYVVRDGLFVYKRPSGGAPAAGRLPTGSACSKRRACGSWATATSAATGTAVRDSPCAVMRRPARALPGPRERPGLLQRVRRRPGFPSALCLTQRWACHVPTEPGHRQRERRERLLERSRPEPACQSQRTTLPPASLLGDQWLHVAPQALRHPPRQGCEGFARPHTASAGDSPRPPS
jgi:hypothetical protein